MRRRLPISEPMHYDWQDLIRQVAACDRCPLCQTRTHPAFGEGNPNAMVMLVGEGPGRDEDLTGRPFVGPAGQLLDRMLAAIDIRREDVYIANVVKCRPPNNRNPEPEEARACLPYLRGQFALVRPKIVLCLGSVAMKHLMLPEGKISRDRGIWMEKKGVWFLATYHPAALLRDERKKREAWIDLQLLREKIRELTEKNEGGQYVRTFQVGQYQE